LGTCSGRHINHGAKLSAGCGCPLLTDPWLLTTVLKAEQPPMSVFPRPLLGRDASVPQDLPFIHGLVHAQSDEEIEPGNHTFEKLCEETEIERNGSAWCPWGMDHAASSSPDSLTGQGLLGIIAMIWCTGICLRETWQPGLSEGLSRWGAIFGPRAVGGCLILRCRSRGCVDSEDSREILRGGILDGDLCDGGRPPWVWPSS